VLYSSYPCTSPVLARWIELIRKKIQRGQYYLLSLSSSDVDECKQQGGSDGHHCNANTRCVNVIGSYTCECLPGYYRIDKFNCAELNECANNSHKCDKHATCVNTVGSYKCICKDGYTGDGYTCKRIVSLIYALSTISRSFS